MKVRLGFLTLATLLSFAPTYPQSYQELEQAFLRAFHDYRSTPGTPLGSQLDSLHNRIGVYLQQPGRQPIENFTLRYYQGYLRYMQATLSSDPVTRRRLLNQSKREFAEAVRHYNPNLGLGDKRAFSVYMQGWCDLRAFLAAPSEADLPYLQAALSTFTRVARDPEANRFLSDARFLQGLSAYLIGEERFKQAVPDPAALEQAAEAFAQDTSATQRLNFLNRAYLAAARYRQGQVRALQALWGAGVSTEGIHPATALVQAHQIWYEDLYKVLPVGHPLLPVSRAGASLAYLQKSRLRATPVSSDSLLLDGLIPEYRTLLQIYRDLLNQTRITAPAPEGEARFWRDLQLYWRFLAGEGAQLPNTLFENIQVDDWRGPYFSALAGFYRTEFLALRRELPSPAQITVSEESLPPVYRQRLRHLRTIANIKHTFDETPPYYDIMNPNGFTQLLQFQPELIPRLLGRHLAQMSEDDLTAFARYLLTLGAVENLFYQPAYLTFEYLRSRNLAAGGLNNTNLDFLQAFCRLGLNDGDAVLQRFSDAYVNALPTPEYRNEAHFYRAMAFRVRANDTRYTAQEINELNRIRMNHPEAGWIVGYEQDISSPNRDQLNLTCTQACDDDQNRFPEVCRACQEDLAYTSPDSTHAIIVGNEHIRYGRLAHLRDAFLAEERANALMFWQVYAKPTPLAGLDCADGAALAGPREFDLSNRIDVRLVVGKPNTAKTVSVINTSDANDCRSFTTRSADTTVSVLALRPYRVVASAADHYPVYKEHVFARQGEELRIADTEYYPALRVSRPTDTRSSLATAIDAADGFVLGGSTPGSLPDVSGGGTPAIAEAGFIPSSVAVLGDRVFVISRVSHAIRTIRSGGERWNPPEQFDQALLNDPSDIAAGADAVFIANRGDASIVRYRPGQKARKFQLRGADLGGIQSIESIESIGNRLFLSDPTKGTVWMVKLPKNPAGGESAQSLTPKPLSGLNDPRAQDLTVPGRLSSFGNAFLLVNDVLTRTVFVFSQFGDYVDQWHLKGLTYVTHVRLEPQTRKFQVWHLSGETVFSMEPTDYNPIAICGQSTLAGPSVDLESSRFCVPGTQ